MGFVAIAMAVGPLVACAMKWPNWACILARRSYDPDPDEVVQLLHEAMSRRKRYRWCRRLRAVTFRNVFARLEIELNNYLPSLESWDGA